MPKKQNTKRDVKSNDEDGKRFDEWMERKRDFHFRGRIPTINEGEIWWCGVGENVGVEINGKSERFSRPVLIIRKFGRFSFVGIPLTSQSHDGSWYAKFQFQGKDSWAVLTQVRSFSVSRLYGRIGTVPNSDLALVTERFLELFA